MTPNEYMTKAKPLTITGFDKELVMKPKKFRSGNFGWFGSTTMKRSVGDQELNLHVNFNGAIPNSKNWKDE